MTYDIFIHKYIHPFVIYVFVGTTVSYLLAVLMGRSPKLRESQSRAIIYGIPFFVPILGYFVYRPFIIDRCAVYGHSLGILNEWMCYWGETLATFLTPLFFIVAVLAIIKAGLSLFVSRRLFGRYPYASPSDYPNLFSAIEKICGQLNCIVPKVIITDEIFARALTMGIKNHVIIISRGLINALDNEEMEAVVAHELAHIKRGDSLLIWVVVFLRDLMFFTPLIYWIFRKFALEKEKAADDIAIQLTQKPMALAQALIKVWKLSPRISFDTFLLDNFMPRHNLVGQTGVLEQRVERILKEESNTRARMLITYAAVSIIVAFSIFILFWVC